MLALGLEPPLREGRGVPAGGGRAVHEEDLRDAPRQPARRVVVERDSLQHEGQPLLFRVEPEIEALSRGQVALDAQALDLAAEAGGPGFVGLARGRRRGRRAAGEGEKGGKRERQG